MHVFVGYIHFESYLFSSTCEELVHVFILSLGVLLLYLFLSGITSFIVFAPDLFLLSPFNLSWIVLAARYQMSLAVSLSHSVSLSLCLPVPLCFPISLSFCLPVSHFILLKKLSTVKSSCWRLNMILKHPTQNTLSQIWTTNRQTIGDNSSLTYRHTNTPTHPHTHTQIATMLTQTHTQTNTHPHKHTLTQTHTHTNSHLHTLTHKNLCSHLHTRAKEDSLTKTWEHAPSIHHPSQKHIPQRSNTNK